MPNKISIVFVIWGKQEQQYELQGHNSQKVLHVSNVFFSAEGMFV